MKTIKRRFQKNNFTLYVLMMVGLFFLNVLLYIGMCAYVSLLK